MRTPTIAAVLAAFLTVPSTAQDAPNFFTQTTPPHVLGPLLQTYGALNGEASELDARTRELIALAVAAQIPCEYCVYAHRKNALNAGASKAELDEAITVAGFVRYFSTAFNGAAYDFETFIREHDAVAPPVE